MLGLVLSDFLCSRCLALVLLFLNNHPLLLGAGNWERLPLNLKIVCSDLIENYVCSSALLILWLLDFTINKTSGFPSIITKRTLTTTLNCASLRNFSTRSFCLG
jgi:hypothetical protein